VLALLALALPATAGATEPDEPVTAVWKERQVQFFYRGVSTGYACSVLQTRVAALLGAVGARPDLQVMVNHCDESPAQMTGPVGNATSWPRSGTALEPVYAPSYPADNGTDWPRNTAAPGSSYRRTAPEQLVDVLIRMSMPVEMTPEVVAELKTDRKRRELITQVTGDPLPLFDDPIPFAARRQVVTLSRETAGIEPADCELLDQMASSVFRQLGVRVVRRGYSCDRSWASRIAPTLEVEALVPVAFNVPPRQAAPATGGQPDPGAPEEAEKPPTTNTAEANQD
jgi:hypothetical protein